MNNLNLTKVRIDVLNVALKIKIALDEIKEKQTTEGNILTQ